MAFAALNLLSAEQQAGVTNDPLHQELWHACAGPLVTLPLEGERVYYFPQGYMEQDMTQQPPWQELVATDLHGNEWHFRHIFRGQPRRHLLTTGWSVFVSSKKLVAGDAFIFLRGANRQLHVGVSRLMRQQANMPSSVISSHSMHLGVLATASHAIATRSMFSVFYKPRTSRSEFIVSVNKYLEARSHKLSIGMRFKMRFEGEEVPERRFSGTIIGVRDNKSSGWAESEWRSLKVQWDEPSSILRPDRVSPRELEPLLETNNSSNSQPAQRNKRARPPVLPSPSSDLSSLGMWKSPVESPFSYCDVQRGHPSPKFSSAAKPNSVGFSGNDSMTAVSSNSMYWSIRVESVKESFAPVVNKDSSERKQGTGNGCRLFGIQLLDNVEENSPVATVSGTGRDDGPVPSLDADSDQHSDPSNLNQSDLPSISCDPEKSCLRSPQESQSKQIWSCTKVHMQGMAVGRAIDLTRFDCYEDLLRKLEEMFDIKGQLCGSAKNWQVVYTYDEDDMMMVGDDPWNEFCSMVRKIFIYTPEEVKKLSPKIKLPVNDNSKPTKPGFDIVVNPEDHL